MKISDKDIEIVKKVLNSKIISEKFPNITKFNIHKTKKGVRIGCKYINDKYVVNENESEDLKNTIIDLLSLSSIECSLNYLYFYRIFNRTKNSDIYSI